MFSIWSFTVYLHVNVIEKLIVINFQLCISSSPLYPLFFHLLLSLPFSLTPSLPPFPFFALPSLTSLSSVFFFSLFSALFLFFKKNYCLFFSFKIISTSQKERWKLDALISKKKWLNLGQGCGIPLQRQAFPSSFFTPYTLHILPPRSLPPPQVDETVFSHKVIFPVLIIMCDWQASLDRIIPGSPEVSVAYLLQYACNVNIC